MPIYDFRCDECKNEEKDVFLKISDPKLKCCGKDMDIVPSLCSAHIFPAEGIYLEHVSPTGKTFHSTKEMQNYARDNKLELGALL